MRHRQANAARDQPNPGCCKYADFCIGVLLTAFGLCSSAPCQALPLLCCAALVNRGQKSPTARHDPDAPRRGCLILAASVRAVPTRAVQQIADRILLRWEAKARAHALSSQQRPSCSKQQHQERAQKAWRHHIRRQGRENGAKTGRPWAIYEPLCSKI